MTHLTVGEKAPNFEGINQFNHLISTAQLSGKKIVLFFYPRASTPGCTVEANSLRDFYQDFVEKGYAIVGVSADTVSKQKSFCDKNNLPFPLIADVDKKIINAYGVWGVKKFMGKTFEGIHRTTFVINEAGVIEQIIEKVETKNHAMQILNRSV